jgi:hypothetical protein
VFGVWYVEFSSFSSFSFVGSVLERHCGNTFSREIGAEESKVGCMDKVIRFVCEFLITPS